MPSARLLNNYLNTAMDKTYHPQSIEQRWYTLWEQRGYFVPAGRKRGDADPASYCIMIPPPNVTGSLHMGHAFQHTIMDVLTRYHRMRGDETLWQAGTDHAGIATQMVVERQLNAEGLTRHAIGREAFVARVWQWKSESGGTITRQLRRMGASLDWQTERFTMDEGLSEAVLETFVRLYHEGLIYRGQRLVNWDPVLHTAVSDLEVQSTEEDGYLWHLRYPLSNGSGHLVVATTRPETMLGDTAVAVHPEDERYRALVGQTVELPLSGRHIPIISDEYVDPAFGSGCVKITPAHDFNDYAVGTRHNLPLINIFTVDARINAEGPKAYRGLDRYQARQRIVADLETLGLIEHVQPHRLPVPRGDRSHAVIEPYLTNQWFVRVAPLAEAAIQAVEDGRIRFVPATWTKTYFEWMRNIQDWCISRQIWWGHRIPAWYDENGNVYVGRSEQQVREQYRLGAAITLTRDADVLDTWFSSALWPFSTLGWPRQTERLAKFYPTSVLVTGFDIIFFWVARMIMMGLKFADDVPFREVYVHGLVRDADGQKMSKSKGNILDPLDLVDGIDLESLVAKRTTGLMQPQLAPAIEKATRKQFPKGIPAFGTDALRYTFCSLATTGRDIRFDLGRIEGYRNFCNKLWNAARFVLLHTEGKDCGQTGGDRAPALIDRWILSLLQQTVQQVRGAVEQYRFDQATQVLYEFIWNEFCDWYLELAKPTLQSNETDAAELRATRHTLVAVLESSLRLMHPFMPFITEEIWQRVAPLTETGGETIMLAPYPPVDVDQIDDRAVEEVNWIKGFVLAIRHVRGQVGIAPSKRVHLLLRRGSPLDRARVQKNAPYLKPLARIDSVAWLDGTAKVPESATALLGELELFLPLAEVIDRNAETKRLARVITQRRQELARAQGKLATPSFVEKAPANVVQKERHKVEELLATITKLEAQLEALS